MRAVITGANRGMGLEFCIQLKERGAEVIGLCRQSSPALDSLGVEVHTGIELSSDTLPRRLKEALGGRSIDYLVNNAGILRRESLDEMSFTRIEEQFRVNALGPLKVTHALLDLLEPGAKVALITSRMGSIGDNTSGSRYGYRMSKAALNIAGVSLAHDLKPNGVAVAILHPGYVRTDMTAQNGLIDAPEAVSGMLARIDSLSLANSGTFWHSNGEELPW